MVDVLVKKGIGGLEPSSEEAYKAFHGIGVGQEVVISIKDPRRRSTDQHRFWFAMVNTLFESQEYYKKLDTFRKAMLVVMGWRKEYHLKNGEIYFEPHSVAFGSMPQETFTQLVDDTLTFAESVGFDRNELMKNTQERTGWVP